MAFGSHFGFFLMSGWNAVLQV